jgi:hypothetical protein
MNTSLPKMPSLNVGDSDRPRSRPRGVTGGVCGYYVDAAHVTPSPSAIETNHPRQTAHVEANPFYLRAANRNPGGKHAASKTDDNQREALAAFEAELLRMRYGFDVAF